MKKLKIYLTVHISSFLLTSFTCVFAQSYHLSGRVYDRIDSTNQTLAGAVIHYDNGRSSAISDATGRFTITVDRGEGELHIFHPNFERTIYPYDLDDQDRMLVVQLERHLPPIRPLIVGDTIPDFLWNLPLQVVNHPGGIDTIRLCNYPDTTLLILDFWARWCAPCVASVEKIESVWKLYPNEMSLLTVHNDLSDVAMPFITQRGWKSPAVVGMDRKILTNSFFIADNIVGGVVYIQNRKVLAITLGAWNNPNIELIHRKFRERRRVFFYSTVDQFNYQGNLDLYFRRLKKYEVANSSLNQE